MPVVIPSMPLAVGEPQSEPAVGTRLHDSASAGDQQACEMAAAVARGDDQAFRNLYDSYHDRLFRLSLMIGGGDEALAHEIVQSVFLIAASKLRRVDSEAHLWNWLARVARQQLGKARRQRQKDSTLVIMESVPDSVLDQPEGELEEKLEAALLNMPADERQLIEWFYFDRLSHRDIAARLGSTPKAVSSRLERTRAKLKSLLAAQT